MTYHTTYPIQEMKGDLGACDVKIIARLAGGEIYRDGALIPGPGHSRDDRSLHVTLARNAPCGFTVHSYAGDDWRDCQDYVLGLLGRCRASEGAKWRKPHFSRREQPLHCEGREESDIRKMQYAHELWLKSTPAIGTQVEFYLASRGLTIDPEITCLRFHPACPFKRERVKAMIAPIVDIRTNCFQGIHRTRLSPKEKAMLGAAKGGCVKLSADEEVTQGLHICEGIETGLSLLQAGFHPLWACLSSAGVSSFPVIPGIECLTIFADNDLSGAGLKAASVCANRWNLASKEVRILLPKTAGADFADGRVS